MRVALVSPYSWTYPGGVTRHIEALAGELLAAGHDVKVLTPYDRDDRRTAWLHRGARPQQRPAPGVAGAARADDRLAVERRRLEPRAHADGDRPAAARAARGQFDVVHVHEPVAPVVGWDALTSADAPLVGTFHCYSESRPPHAIAALHGRPPQAQPARRADRGVRRRRLDRPALLRRRLPGHPQRRRAARGRRARAARARARRAAGDRRSSARPSSARACRSCCAPSRRCASTCPVAADDRRRLRVGGRAAARRAATA